MTTSRTACGLVALVIVAGIFCLAVMGAGITNNLDHANTNHLEAPAIRDRHRDRLCEGEELWYSPSRGTVLILCGIPDNPKWGGLIYRVTENGGEQVLSGDDAYECTVLSASRHYWDETIGRDGYFPLAWRPDLARTLRTMWGW